MVKHHNGCIKTNWWLIITMAVIAQQRHQSYQLLNSFQICVFPSIWVGLLFSHHHLHHHQKTSMIVVIVIIIITCAFPCFPVGLLTDSLDGVLKRFGFNINHLPLPIASAIVLSVGFGWVINWVISFKLKVTWHCWTLYYIFCTLYV